VGWYLPVHPALLRYALEHDKFLIPFDPRRTATIVGPGSIHWPWICEGMRSSPSIGTRREVLDDVIYCLEHARWHAAISTALPILEGVISDRSGVLDGPRVGRRLRQLLHNETGQLETISAVPALGVLDQELFKRLPFGNVAISDEALNRHLILHGRIAGFGKPAAAMRVFMLLVALVELLDGALILRSSAPAADEGSLLDEFGPLAPLRNLTLLGRASPTNS
jgi:hypothetical protein